MMLRGSSAIVTGGGRGIGRAVSLALGREGCNVVVAARSRDEVAEVEREVERAGSRALAVSVDLAEPDAAGRLVDAAVAAFGGVQVLVNNAGVLPDSRIPDITAREWDETMAVNLRSVFLLSQRVLELMKKAGRGYIVNVSSPACLRVSSRLAAYGVSKAAVVALSQALFDEAKSHGIKVSTLYPGYVDTRMLRELEHAGAPPEQWAQPEDMAECVLFLLKQSDRVIVKDLMALAFGAE